MKKILLLLCLTCGILTAQTIDTTLWTINTGGQVNDIIKDGNTLYIAGTFTKVGLNTGCLSSFQQSDASKSANLPIVTPGTIHTTVPDGNGGWFIGGTFTVVNGLNYANLIHIRSDGKLNTAFNPSPNGAIRAIVVRNGRLYVAGSFSTIALQSRSNIAEIDIASGLVTSWNPGINGVVNTMVLSASKLYLGGTFTTVNSQNRARVACMDLSIGINTPWNPNITNGAVNSMVVHGARVYIGGTFTTVGGQTRNRIASVDTINGLVSGWDPGANNAINALVASGSLIYAGGSFTSIGGFGLNRLAAVDTTTAAATTWSPNPDGVVNAIALSGSFVYAGGSFNNIGGQPQSFVAKISDLGQQVAWNAGVNASVTSLAISGSSVITGGTFNASNEVTRNRIAAIDLTTGAATAWNPNANNTVNALAIYQNAVIAGGTFTNVGGTAINRLVAIDKTTGAPSAWNPNPNNAVNCLLVNGQSIFVGGTFSTIGGQSRSRLASIDLGTAIPDGFNPNVNNTVNDMVLSGQNLIVGGAFTTIGGVTRNRLASINVSSGTASSWNPNANGVVLTLKLGGSVIYAGGSFSQVGGLTRSRLVAIDTSSSIPESWAIASNNEVQSLFLSGGTLYIGGEFSSIGGQTRSRLAAADTVGAGQVLAWNPNANDDVFALFVSNECSNETVYAGGVFTTVKNIQQKGLAAISGFNQVAISRTVTNVTCNGLSNGEVNLSVTGGSSPYTYSKDNTNFQATGNFTGLAAGNYTFYLKDANNCIIESRATVTEPSAIIPNEVIFNETCEDQNNGAINLAPAGGKPPYTFNWSSGTTAQNVSGLSGGTYTVIITDNSGCQKSQPFVVGSNPLPEANFNIVFGQGVVNFTDQSTGSPSSYAWDFGDSGTSTLPSPSHTYSAMGNYKVCLTVTNDCGSDSSCKIINSTAVDDFLAWGHPVRLMPNPATEFTVVETGISQAEPVYWMLNDLTGRVIYPAQKAQDKLIAIDLSGLSKGIYLLRLSREGHAATLRLIRE
jgi:trimeric autotransporter adhesin